MREADKSEQEQKQDHVIYEGFNTKLYEILEALSTKLPKNAKTYSKIAKTIRAAADKDISYPMNVWLENIDGYDHVLREYNETNVLEFVKVAPQIPLLDCLEISENWHKFKPKDIKALWGHFKGLFTYSDTATVIPVDLMTEIQNMTDDLERQGLIDLTQDIDIASAAQILKSAMGANTKIQEGIAKMNAMFGTGNTAPEPPTYSKRRGMVDRE
jgi:hypothetical protein